MPKAYCLHIEKELTATCDFLNTRSELEHPPLDLRAPYRPAHTGLYAREIPAGGAGRKAAFFIPESYPPSGEAVFLFAPSGCDEAAFWTQNPHWQSLAAARGVMLVLCLAGLGGWSRQDIQREFDYVDGVLEVLLSKAFCSANEASYYFIGLGDAAYVAAAFGLARSEIVAAFVADGDCALHPDLLAQIAGMTAMGAPDTPLWHYPVCAWLNDKGAEATAAYIRKTLRCGEAPDFRTAQAQVWLQSPVAFYPNWNDEPCAQLWCGGEMLSAPEQSDAWLDFLLRVKRWFGAGNGNLRPTRTAEGLGLRRYEQVIDGLPRHWYVYEPSNPAGAPMPLVLALHGYSCTGELFAQNAEWHAVARENGFLVVYPTAWPGITEGNCTPLPMWRNGPAVWGDMNDVDDVSFLSQLLDEVAAAYPIDPSRVYVTGHSNGAVMTQMLMQKIPERFAAAAPVGLTHGDLGVLPYAEAPATSLPAWLIKGEYDIGCACDLGPDSPNTQKLALLCMQNGVVDAASRDYTQGVYRNKIWYDPAHRPMVGFTEVAGLPHAYTPDMADMIWRQFFCRFSRAKDGSIAYHG